MQTLFTKCIDAINQANTTKTFGCFYSDKHDANGNIHLHECYEILFCLSGGKTFFIDDRIYDVSDGDIFVLNAFEAHKITSCEGEKFKRFVMQVHPTFVYDASTSETDLSKCFNVRSKNVSHKLSLSSDEIFEMESIFKKMTAEYSIGDDILKKIAAVELLTKVNKYFYEKNTDFTYHFDYKNKTIVTAIKYINGNYNEPLSLESVSKNSFVSANELNRLFKNHMGTTVTKYILSRRITEAKKLLKNGDTVYDAAEKCGFMDYASFIRAFKRVVGVPPGQYKKR